MGDQGKDQSVLTHIQELVTEEHRSYASGTQGALSEAESARLKTIEVELDQCWDLLRQRRGLRDAGHDPGEARVRPPEVVEKYEQ